MEKSKPSQLINSSFILISLLLLIFLGSGFNFYQATAIQGKDYLAQAKSILYSLGILDLKRASLEEIAKGTLPSEEDEIRPIKINGKAVHLSLDDANLNLIMSQDPFPPNGSSSFPPFGEPETPQGLSPEKAVIYNKLMYGTEDNQFQDAVGGCLYCNAPGGAGGCFKKRVIRGLTYTMLKQGWSEKEIIDELRVWQKFFFPGLAIKWTKYYAQKGVEPDEIPIDVKTFSLQGSRFVNAALAGEDTSKVPEQVGGCFRG